jgi:predicted amidohydrolase
MAMNKRETTPTGASGPMNSKSLRVAAGQILVVGGEPNENLRRAVEAVRLAADQDCQVLVLPECLDLGWTHPSARDAAELVPGPRSDTLCRAAREHRIAVVAGLTERADDAVYNTAVLIDENGQLRLKYRKINVLDIAQDLYEIGDRVGVQRMPWARVGLNICADNFPNSLELGGTLGRMGAQLVLSPCAWAVAADHDQLAEPYGQLWRTSYSQLARQFGMPVVGVSNVGPIDAGPWAGRKCIGCSLMVNHRGEVVAEGPYEQEALLVEDLELVTNPAKGTNISGCL